MLTNNKASGQGLFCLLALFPLLPYTCFYQFMYHSTGYR